MSEGAVKVAVHRLRQRYRKLLRAAIAETVSNEADLNDEMRYLVAVLRRRRIFSVTSRRVSFRNK